MILKKVQIFLDFCNFCRNLHISKEVVEFFNKCYKQENLTRDCHAYNMHYKHDRKINYVSNLL